MLEGEDTEICFITLLSHTALENGHRPSDGEPHRGEASVERPVLSLSNTCQASFLPPSFFCFFSTKHCRST